MTIFVEMYHPALPGTPHVAVPEQAHTLYAAHGWLDVDGSTPAPEPIYLTPGVGDLRYAKTNDIGTPGTATGDAIRAAYVPKWKPSTAYASGEAVLNPSGQTVTANSAFTSGASYNAANWTVVSGLSVAATASADATLAANKHTPVDTSAAARTMTLPTGQTEGTRIIVEKIDASANTVTVSGSIRGSAGTVSLVGQFETLSFLADSAGSWHPGPGHKTKAWLDSTYVKMVAAPTGVAATDRANIQAALTAANTAGGGVVQLQAGTYLVDVTLVLYTQVNLRGMGRDVTFLKLADGAHTDLLITDQFYTLTGTTNGGGIHSFTLEDMTLDGNWNGQTSTDVSWPLRIYGYDYMISNLKIKNGQRGGAWSEWRAPTDPGLEESHWHNVNIDNYQGGANPRTTYGLYFDGPHDSQFTDVLISSLAANHSWNGPLTYGLYVGPNAESIQADKLHIFGRHTHALYLASATCFFSNCYIEGATVANVVMSSGSTFIGGFILGTNGNTGTQTNEIGFQMGDSAAGIQCKGAVILGTYVQAFTDPGRCINFSNEVGANVIKCVTATQASALYSGTPRADDILEIVPRDAAASGLYQAAGTAVGASMQVYTASATWTKPVGCVGVQATLIGGGGGGQSGGRQAAGVACVGGSGGGGGGYSSVVIPASAAGTTAAVTVGAAGTGGAAVATDSTAGTSGTAGAASSFANFAVALGGGAGSQLNGGAGGGAETMVGGAGAPAIASGAVPSPPATSMVGGGGAGGGITTASAVSTGSTGGKGQGGQLAGGTLGNAAPGSNGNPSVAYAGGSGGGGGGAGTAGGFAGGNGAIYGAGGGGGGASQNGAASGKGGDGAPGLVIVSTW